MPDIIEQTFYLIHSKNSGLYHLGSEGCITWYDFAQRILEYAQLNVPIEAVDSSAFPTKAKRPHFSKLSTRKLEATGMLYLLGKLGVKP